MKQFTRTITVENERAEGKTFEKDARGFRESRFEKIKDAKVDDIGVHPDLKLRETDDRDEMVAAVRGKAAKLARFTVTESPAEALAEPVAPTNNEALEKLSDVERACLESMKEDFNRGIVLIDPKDEDGNDMEMNKAAYQAALRQDKTAGQSWEAVQGRLVNNGKATVLLKKAVELSELTGDQEGKGACLVGVYRNGELAIRQRSSEIVNVIVDREGSQRLAFHPEAQLEEGEQWWAKAVEIVRAVKAAGYHVPANAPSYIKKGLVAASEAVTGADYVASPNRNEWRNAILECPDSISDDAYVRIVNFTPGGYAYVSLVYADFRDAFRGAVLWLKG